ncbi:zinc-binding dehydrogenase [Pseudonocardia xishanensis]
MQGPLAGQLGTARPELRCHADTGVGTDRQISSARSGASRRWSVSIAATASSSAAHPGDVRGGRRETRVPRALPGHRAGAEAVPHPADVGAPRCPRAGSRRPAGTSALPTLPAHPDGADARRAADLGVRSERLLVESDQAGMRAIAELAGSDRFRAHIDATFPLAEAAKAHALGGTGRTRDRILLLVR